MGVNCCVGLAGTSNEEPTNTQKADFVWDTFTILCVFAGSSLNILQVDVVLC